MGEAEFGVAAVELAVEIVVAEAGEDAAEEAQGFGRGDDFVEVGGLGGVAEDEPSAGGAAVVGVE